MPAAAPSTRPQRARRADRFRYEGFSVDEASGVVRCSYRLDGHPFVETVSVGAGWEWTPAAYEAARLVHLLAGVSYYKAGAARTIDLGETPVRPTERDFLGSFYRDGLGEFAYRNGLSLDDVEILGGVDVGPVAAAASSLSGRPLIPFGGGIDSLVTVDAVTRAVDDAALFVVNRAGNRFQAIERAAAATGLPVLRAEREIDPAILRPADPSAVFNGHVPVTGVLSAVAVLVAALDRRGMVVMSNEWSASRGNLVTNGRTVNHQFSKSEAFENGFRRVLAGGGTGLEYFSLLRPFSELWVARRFAAMTRFHGVVHSCNRAFHLDPTQRLDHWCGRCDKCSFIDLILSPFLDAAALAAGIFGGREPLADPSLLPQFRALVGLGDDRKPFECVGDVDECRTAAALAAERPDRAGNPMLAALTAELGPDAVAAARADAGRLLQPLSAHHIPGALFTAAALA